MIFSILVQIPSCILKYFHPCSKFMQLSLVLSVTEDKIFWIDVLLAFTLLNCQHCARRFLLPMFTDLQRVIDISLVAVYLNSLDTSVHMTEDVVW